MKAEQAFIADMHDIIGPHIGNDVGHDGFIYGSYVDWGNVESFDEATILALLEYFGIDLPFGQSVDACDEYRKRVYERYGVDVPIPDEAERFFTFPLLRDIRPQVNKALLAKEIPQGVVFEADMGEDYPDEMRYWATEFASDAEYEFLKAHPLPLREYLSGIEAIRSEYASAESGVVKCALILSALVHAEYYVKSTLLEAAISQRFERSEFSNLARYRQEIILKLQTSEGRKRLHRNLFQKRMASEPFRNLRNSLAHSITASRIEHSEKGDVIFYEGRDHNEASDLVDSVFNRLSSYRCGLHTTTGS